MFIPGRENKANRVAVNRFLRNDLINLLQLVESSPVPTAESGLFPAVGRALIMNQHAGCLDFHDTSPLDL